MQRLEGATGADVAASEDLTGAAALGGDWVLEGKSGVASDITTASLAINGYQGVLGTVQ